MGAAFSCPNCAVEQGNCTLVAFSLCETCAAAQRRRERLMAGAKFSRRTSTFGISTGSESLMLRLADDGLGLSWRTMSAAASKAGQLQLVHVSSVSADGEKGLRVTNNEGEAVLELEAASCSERNAWVTSLTEVVEQVKENPLRRPPAAQTQTEAPTASLTAASKDNEAAYWKSRKAELDARERERKELRAKYAGAGMKYTAQAMASR